MSLLFIDNNSNAASELSMSITLFALTYTAKYTIGTGNPGLGGKITMILCTPLPPHRMMGLMDPELGITRVISHFSL